MGNVFKVEGYLQSFTGTMAVVYVPPTKWAQYKVPHQKLVVYFGNDEVRRFVHQIEDEDTYIRFKGYIKNDYPTVRLVALEVE